MPLSSGMSAVGGALASGRASLVGTASAAPAQAVDGRERAGRPRREQRLQAGDLDARSGSSSGGAPSGSRGSWRWSSPTTTARRPSFRQAVDVGAEAEPAGHDLRPSRVERPRLRPSGCTTSRAAGGGDEVVASDRSRARRESGPRRSLLAHAGRAAGGRADPEPARLQRPRQSGHARQRGHGRPARRGRGPLARPLVRLRRGPGRGARHQRPRGHGDPRRPPGPGPGRLGPARRPPGRRGRGQLAARSATASSARSCPRVPDRPGAGRRPRGARIVRRRDQADHPAGRRAGDGRRSSRRSRSAAARCSARAVDSRWSSAGRTASAG